MVVLFYLSVRIDQAMEHVHSNIDVTASQSTAKILCYAVLEYC